MTDPGFADRTYLEPLDLEGVAGVLRRERPDALLPTMGGQTALNLARELDERRRPRRARHRADRRRARGDRARRGPRALQAGRRALRAARRRLARSSPTLAELDGLAAAGRRAARRSRSAATAAGSSTRRAELAGQVERGLAASPIGQVLVEESLRGWDEFELEVVRDRADNVVIVCSIENLDPMGVHTGDSVTVAPQMTLPDEAYQELRDAAFAIVRAVGVDTGGANVQFARDRDSGEFRVIEMNPRVSRSSALASKATGYPIAKVAALLAVGYTLDEIPNDLTGTTPGELRAGARLRRRQVPALRLREVPGRRPDARHADEVGRRVDGHRPHLRRGVRQGAPRPRGRPRVAAREPPSRGSPAELDAARRRAAHDRLPPRRLVRRRGRGALELLLLDPRRARRGSRPSRAARS